jgi:hypothetical protein
MSLEKSAKNAGSYGNKKLLFDNLISYPDMGISIIIYRLSNIYMSQIRIVLFGTTQTYQMQIEFSSYVNLDKA